jgi:hypothetical protein
MIKDKIKSALEAAYRTTDLLEKAWAAADAAHNTVGPRGAVWAAADTAAEAADTTARLACSAAAHAGDELYGALGAGATEALLATLREISCGCTTGDKLIALDKGFECIKQKCNLK